MTPWWKVTALSTAAVWLFGRLAVVWCGLGAQKVWALMPLRSSMILCSIYIGWQRPLDPCLGDPIVGYM